MGTGSTHEGCDLAGGHVFPPGPHDEVAFFLFIG
ncbi:hypothetical protein AMIS_20110 [Actinoplanes missouriensis 431]|uniref:Uncharacterized protein n=1 Tax=Actinoplanes missouriensis (strain ATCC 14538 / DSM 43046 / CBS 188.64 / JCM 3121 / NBRC 102363 / NCIMB 12654 / NRRL B-3342 / UNCC 431) TaxID=512565 RepID=I0H2J4_ACTM4|nr:hypothetical protein AMIS_20110 [Actinoplanes missouriensis 431]